MCTFGITKNTVIYVWLLKLLASCDYGKITQRGGI